VKIYGLKVDKFKQYIAQAGATMLESTNEYERIRFNSKNGIGIVYDSKSGHTLTGAAIIAHEFFERKKQWVAGNNYKAWQRLGVVDNLLRRDGQDCFYCASPLGDDMTVEHILSKIHGGSDNEANLCLTHVACNRDAGCLPVAEKIKMFFKMR